VGGDDADRAVLVTPDEIDQRGPACRMLCRWRAQAGRALDLIFDPAFLVSYISTFITLELVI